MGWRFRKSFSPLPGVRLTLSPRGISTSVGVGPFRLTQGTQGPALTTRLPGTGIAFRLPLVAGPAPARGGSAPRFVPALDFSPTLPPVHPLGDAARMREVGSASTQEMTSPGLSAFKDLLLQAKAEQAAIASELASAQATERQAVKTHARWHDGWLLRRLRKERFAQLQQDAQRATEVREELEQQRDLARLSTQIDLPDNARAAFAHLCEAMAALRDAARIWDTVQARSTNQVAERTSATRTIERKSVTFRLGRCAVLDTEWDVPHLGNANGGDVYLYPGFVLYFVGEQDFSLLELSEVELLFEPMRFHETGPIAPDTQVVDRTWVKVNKDGSPDRRFKGNHEIPVVLYGQLTMRSPTGMCEEWLVSNAQVAQAFAAAWAAFRQAVRDGP